MAQGFHISETDQMKIAIIATIGTMLSLCFCGNAALYAAAHSHHIARNKPDVWSRFSTAEGTWRAAEFLITINSQKQPSLYVYRVSDANDLDSLTRYLCWRYARRNRDAEVEVKSSWGEDHSSGVECSCDYDPTDKRTWPMDFLRKH